MFQARIDTLRDALPRLAVADQSFARDLLANYGRHGALSDKQWLWVDKLAERAESPPAAPCTERVGDFSGVIGLFARARSKLQYPKITLQVGHQPIQLSLAGARSKYEGQVQVTDGRPFGQNVWFGRVDQAGTWTQGHTATEPENDAVREFLRAFSKDPAATAQEHGRLTGRCCFCNAALKDDHSTAAGFGPVCAKTYGLEAEWKSATALLSEVAEQAQATIENASKRTVSVAQ
jgi:hypothetical protein